MEETGALARLETDGLVRSGPEGTRATARWQAAMARAALRLQRSDAPWRDLRLPIAAALLEVCDDVSDRELAERVEAMLSIEMRELSGAKSVMPKTPTVREYMDTRRLILSPDDDILLAVRRLIDEGVTGAPVADHAGTIIGELSEYECLRLVAEGHAGEVPRGQVEDFMATEFTAVPPTMDIYYVAGMFLRDRAHRRFMVMDGREFLGVVTRKDILRAVHAGLRAE
jgi:predicted transcriptional regulator